MTVKELIEHLQGMDQGATVHFAHGAGDYWRTTVAPTIRRVEEGRVSHSGYHEKSVLIDEDDKRYDEATEVVVLS